VKKISLNKILSFLILIFPISLITGPLIPEIILAIVSIAINYQIIKNKKFHYYKFQFSNFFLIFWLYLIVNSVFAENPLWSLRTSIFYFRYYIFSISIFYLIENKLLNLKTLSILIMSVFCVLIFDLFIQYYFGQNLLGLLPSENRYSGLFGEELILGSYLIKLFPLLLALVFLKKNNSNQLFYIIFFNPIIVLGLILTGERTASFLGLIFIILASFILLKKYKYKLLYLFSLIIIFLGILQISPNLKGRFINDTLDYIIETRLNKIQNVENLQLEINQNEKNIYIISKLHHGHYLSAYKLFLEKPIFGNGVNSFRNKCIKFDHEYSCSTHPHNLPIQILSEIGIVGFTFYLIVIFYFIRNLFKKNNSISLKILSLGLFLYLFPFAPSGNFFNNWMNMTLYFFIGFYLAFMRYNLPINDK
jgi:O-antigen ligase